VLYWLHSPVPRRELPKWVECQRVIDRVLQRFGADPQCRDAARVLRVVGTVNSKNQKMVESIGPNWRAWEWEDLCEDLEGLNDATLGAPHRSGWYHRHWDDLCNTVARLCSRIDTERLPPKCTFARWVEGVLTLDVHRSTSLLAFTNVRETVVYSKDHNR
jgi:hypothetical protein